MAQVQAVRQVVQQVAQQQEEEAQLKNEIVTQLASNFYTHMKTRLDGTWLRDPLRVAISYILSMGNKAEQRQAAMELTWDGDSDVKPDEAVDEVRKLLDPKTRALNMLSQVIIERLLVCYGVATVQHLFRKRGNDMFAIELSFRGRRAMPLPQVLLDNVLFKAKDPEGFFARSLTDKFNQSVQAMQRMKKKPAEMDIDFLLNFIFGIALFIGSGLAFVSACLPKGDTDEEKEKWESTKKPLDITATLFLFLASLVIFVIAGFRASEHKKNKEEHGQHMKITQALVYEMFPAQEVEDGFGVADDAPTPLNASEVFMPVKQDSFVLDPPVREPQRQAARDQSVPLPRGPQPSEDPQEPRLTIHRDPTDPLPPIRSSPLSLPVSDRPVLPPIRTVPVSDSPVRNPLDNPTPLPLPKQDASLSYHKRVNNPFRKMSADYAYGGRGKVHYV